MGLRYSSEENRFKTGSNKKISGDEGKWMTRNRNFQGADQTIRLTIYMQTICLPVESPGLNQDTKKRKSQPDSFSNV
jgi:hypothetical protein